jgi:glycosyltransferase involved in cell wall biosynthesis
VTIRVPPDPGISGVERYSFDLARGLHALGHEVHVFCQSETPLRRDSLGLSIHGIPRSAYPEGALFPGRPVVDKNLGYGQAVARKLEALYREGVELDVLHTTNWDLMAVCPAFHRVLALHN